MTRELIPRSREQGTAPSLWREEFSPLGSFRREMDRLFDDFFKAPTFSRFGDFGGQLQTTGRLPRPSPAQARSRSPTSGLRQARGWRSCA